MNIEIDKKIITEYITDKISRCTRDLQDWVILNNQLIKKSVNPPVSDIIPHNLIQDIILAFILHKEIEILLYFSLRMGKGVMQIEDYFTFNIYNPNDIDNSNMGHHHNNNNTTSIYSNYQQAINLHWSDVIVISRDTKIETIIK